MTAWPQLKTARQLIEDDIVPEIVGERTLLGLAKTHHIGRKMGRDAECECGAVSILDGLEAAWALLWATQTSDRRVHEARAILRQLLTDDGPARGIELLPDWAKPTAPSVAEAISGDYP